MSESLENVSVQVGRNDAKTWNGIIAEFDDATLYQTHAYGAFAKQNRSISHLVIRQANKVLSCSQIVIRTLPFGIGTAEIKWGPLWMRNGGESTLPDFSNVVRQIKNEYGVKRGLL